MLFKSSTNLTSGVSALLQSHKAQRQVFVLAACVTVLVLWKLYTGVNAASQADACTTSSESATNDEKMAGMKWSYDELAHKLIIENTDLAYAEIGEAFTKGIGRALNKVTRHGFARQNGGKPVVVNL